VSPLPNDGAGGGEGGGNALDPPDDCGDRAETCCGAPLDWPAWLLDAPPWGDEEPAPLPEPVPLAPEELLAALSETPLPADAKVPPPCWDTDPVDEEPPDEPEALD
jgi:hypothetical protein